MSDLVILKDGTPVTTTLAIAEGTRVQHKAIIQLTRTYLSDLERFGLVTFEMRPRSKGQHGGGDTEYAILNERQSTLLLTYMRNTKVVREFKIRLVAKFYEMAGALVSQSSVTEQPAVDTRPAIPALEYVKLMRADFPNLGETAMQQLYSEVSEIDLGRRLIPLPVIAEKFWTASELALELGVTANKIGRLANAFGLKGEGFGEYRLSKSRHSAKQVEQFYYNREGRAALEKLLANGSVH